MQWLHSAHHFFVVIYERKSHVCKSKAVNISSRIWHLSSKYEMSKKTYLYNIICTFLYFEWEFDQVGLWLVKRLQLPVIFFPWLPCQQLPQFIRKSLRCKFLWRFCLKVGKHQVKKLHGAFVLWWASLRGGMAIWPHLGNLNRQMATWPRFQTWIEQQRRGADVCSLQQKEMF